MKQSLSADLLEPEWPQLPEVKLDSHKHSLVLNSDYNRDEDEDEIICDGCTEPIDHASSPHYKCGQYCNFFLHASCATLPTHEDRIRYMAELYSPKNPWEVLKCNACNSFCNGYVYKCTKSGCNFCLDIKCSYLMGMITHTAHKHHLSSREFWFIDDIFTCSGCGEPDNAPHFYCKPCNFRIGFECANLPATVRHRWDKHPLILSFPPFFRFTDTDGDDEFYCEVCEEEIHPKHWMYRCGECDQFGKACSIKCHPHRLYMVPQAKLTSPCHACGKSLYWSRAFECAPCGFYLCPDCLPKEELVVE